MPSLQVVLDLLSILFEGILGEYEISMIRLLMEVEFPASLWTADITFAEAGFESDIRR